jgi:hypothetical protein
MDDPGPDKARDKRDHGEQDEQWQRNAKDQPERERDGWKPGDRQAEQGTVTDQSSSPEGDRDEARADRDDDDEGCKPDHVRCSPPMACRV